MTRKRSMPAWPALVLAIGLSGGCGQPPATPEEVVRPVHVYTVPDPAQERVRAFAGTARPALETEISFRVGGEIVELLFKPGQSIRAGDVLARLDPTDYVLQLRQAEAQRDQAEAQFKQADSQYARVRELYESQSASKSDLDQARAAAESCSAQLEAAEKAVELSRLQMEYCTLEAPFDGQVISKSVEQRQTVGAGQTVATLSSGRAMEMVVGIPETLINRVRLGGPATVAFDSISDRSYAAEITEVGVENTGKSTYPVRLSIRDQDERIRAGMAGEAAIAFAAEGQGMLIVPPESVASEARGTYFVWVVDPDTDCVQKRMVQPGALTSAGLAILDGLEPGEQIVTRGVHKLTEGTRVRVPAPDAKAP